MLHLSSCSDADMTTETLDDYKGAIPSIPYNSNPYDSVGKLHNDICHHYKTYYQENIETRFYEFDSVSYISKAAYDNIINAIYDYTVNYLNANSDTILFITNELYSFNNNFGLDTNINGVDYVKILKDYMGAIDYYNGANILDTETYSFLSNIYINNEPYYNCNIESLIENETNAQEPNWPNSIISSYIAVYYHSKEFWEPISTLTRPQPCGLSPSQAIIVADAAGYVVGTLMSGGPWGGFVGSTLYSLAEAEYQKNGISLLCGSEYIESAYYNPEN